MKNLRWVFLGLLMGASALAQVPSKVGYQGLLLRADGTPERGMVTIRFSLHDAETGGTELWSETQTLLLTDGFYMTQLGEITPLPPTAFDAPTRFLQLTVAGTALQPRLKFASVPFALLAGGISGGSVNASSVKVNNTPVVAINTASGCNGGDVARWNGSSWACGAPVAGGGVTSVTASAPLSVVGTTTPNITLGTVPVSRGGTGADFSATGGAGQVVKQSGAGAPLSVGALTGGDLPSHSHGAADIISGTLAQVRGGTGLAATPANGTFLRSASGTWTAAPLTATDLPPGNVSYLQNQTAVDQPASLRIDGSASLGSYLTAASAIIGPWTTTPNATFVVNRGAAGAAVRIGASAPLYLNAALPSVTFNGRSDATGNSLISEGGYVAQIVQNPSIGQLEFWTSSTTGAAGTTLPRLKSLEVLPAGTLPCSGNCEPGPALHLPGGRLAVPWGFDISHFDGVSAKPVLKKFWNGSDFDSLLLSSTSTGGSLQMAMILNSGPGFVRFGRPLTNGEGLGTEYLRLAQNCVMTGLGSVIAGTCVSDARLKKDVRPLSDTLDLLAALQPVSYLWRADEFPTRSFGSQREYGLIAQQVEQVLPELVTRDDQGFRAVRYERLPLLTLQAVRELKGRDEARAQELRAAKQRLEALERENGELRARIGAIEKALGLGQPVP